MKNDCNASLYGIIYFEVLFECTFMVTQKLKYSNKLFGRLRRVRYLARVIIIAIFVETDVLKKLVRDDPFFLIKPPEYKFEVKVPLIGFQTSIAS